MIPSGTDCPVIVIYHRYLNLLKIRSRYAFCFVKLKKNFKVIFSGMKLMNAVATFAKIYNILSKTMLDRNRYTIANIQLLIN